MLDRPKGTMVRCGPIGVRSDSSEIAGFRSALDSEWKAGVPLTYPIRWRGLPAVRDLIAELVGEGELLVQQSQTFDWHHRMEPDCDYEIEIEGSREDTRSGRIVLDGTISDVSGRVIARLRSVLVVKDG